MNLREWDERYRTEDFRGGLVTPLLSEYTARETPGSALDLACGAGRNAVWLAERGWDVTAVDGAQAAIDSLIRRNPAVRTVVADLEQHAFTIEPEAWDLILMSFYLQRDLFPPMKGGVRSGGLIIAIAHITRPGEEPNYKRAAPGELRGFFDGWRILHDYEGPSRDPAHKRPVAEIVARRP